MDLASPFSPCQYEIFAKSSQGDHVRGLTNVSFAKDRACSACIEGKLHDKAHPPMTIIYSKRPLELLHLDLFGPPSFDSVGGRKYCLVIVDDYPRYTWVYFFKRKSETQQTFIDFANEAQRQHNAKILKIRRDNDTEFKNYTLDEFLSDGDQASIFCTLHPSTKWCSG